MANNKTKVDRLHDLLPKHLNSRRNPNWKALVEAIGEEDQRLTDLVSQVKEQLFVKTASRPYLDRIAANNNISRPKLVGMDDVSFRQYIPVLSYQPKQVKRIIDELLDIFFFKESTTAYVTSQAFSPFALQSGWELEYEVDEANSERIQFNSSDFANINSAKTDEIVAAINRQTKYSYATNYNDSITKNSYVRIFTNTIGSKGSIRLLGGRANSILQLNGFIYTAGNGSNTQWTVSKVGDIATFQYVGGASPNIDQLQSGDVFISNLSGNVGSFPIISIDLVNNLFTIQNLFATPGTFTQINSLQAKFFRPKKYVAYTSDRRAITWEVSPNEIIVEMPTSPPVVRRSLRGSIHMNGAISQMASRDSDTSLTLASANQFPNAGIFWLEPVNEIQTRYLTPSENTLDSNSMNTRLEGSPIKYSYTSRTALTTTGDLVQGTTQITNLASVLGLAVGQNIVMAGVPGYARVVSISGNLVNITHPAAETLAGQSVSFLGNQLVGISPALPALAVLNERTLSSLVRNSGVVTAMTSSVHGFVPGEAISITGSSGILSLVTTGNTTLNSNLLTNLVSTATLAPGMLIVGTGIPAGTSVLSISGNTVTMSTKATATAVGITANFNENLNGSFIIKSVTSTAFTFDLLGLDGTATTPGTSRVEREGLSADGSKVILSTAIPHSNSRITGSYVWDLSAPFVLSSNTATITDSIQAGKIVRLLNMSPNSIPATGGYVMFDYGLETQEGPVRYLYAPTNGTLALDPSYIFQHSHTSGSTVISISHKGPHAMSVSGAEYAPYITNPSDARFILEDLIRSVKSAGIFVDFLIRYPEQLYSTLDVYQSGQLPE